jgi:hypothetical protein
MRYAQRGGYTPAEQQRRERLRLEAAGRFARGDKISEIAHDLRVTPGRCGARIGPGRTAGPRRCGRGGRCRGRGSARSSGPGWS